MLNLLMGAGISPECYEQYVQTGNLSFLYSPDWFDITIMLVYVGILAFLSFYGLRKYYYLSVFRKNKDVRQLPAGHFDELPIVTVQLPMYNEMYVGRRVLDAVCQFDYPKDRLHVQVLDDSTDETVEVMQTACQYWRQRGFDVEYVHRANREGFKAGALCNGMETAKGDIIAIFDADFVPHADFLQKTVHHFTDPMVGIVQTRWAHINENYSLLTRIQGIFLDGHFMMESLPRSRAGLYVNFNGTAGLWRRQAIEAAGGWEHDTITEDLDLSIRAQMKGWKYVYLPEIECPAELPVEMNAYKNQQNRWAKGSTQVCRKLFWTVMKSDIPKPVKTELFFHLTANLAFPLMNLLALILVPAMIVRFNQGLREMFLLDLPIFLASTVSVVLFYVESQKALHADWKKRAMLLPALMAVGIGLAVTNGKGVIEALLGIQSSFVRTPKYQVTGKKDNWKKKTRKYRGKVGFWPLVEIAMGSYYIWVFCYCLSIGNYGVLPFLLLFIGGYFYTGGFSLCHNLLKFQFVDVQWQRMRRLLGAELQEELQD